MPQVWGRDGFTGDYESGYWHSGSGLLIFIVIICLALCVCVPLGVFVWLFMVRRRRARGNAEAAGPQIVWKEVQYPTRTAV